MLKISEPTAKHATTLKLEGRLVGPWVSQLRDICEAHLTQSRCVMLDFTDVTYADRGGVLLLLDLRASGVELVNCSPFLAEELKAGA